MLYGPLVGKAAASRAWEAASPDRWVLLLLVLFGLRALTYQLWSSFSNMLFATRRRRVVRDGVDFEQIDREWDWYVCTVRRRKRIGIPIRSLQATLDRFSPAAN